MKAIHKLLMLVLLGTIPVLVVAAPPDDKGQGKDAPEEEASPPNYSKLPDPLQEVSGNMLDFEKSGHFTITDVRFGPAGTDYGDAILWTLRANKRASYRFIEIYFRGFQEVGFHGSGKTLERPFFSTLLFHDRGIDFDAVNGKFLPKNGTIEVWFFLDKVDVQKVINGGAAKVMFRPAKR